MKKQEWQAHVESWKVSAQSKKSYAAEHGLKYATFVYHTNRIEADLMPGSFKKLIPTQVTGSVEILLPNGVRIFLPVGALDSGLLIELNNV